MLGTIQHAARVGAERRRGVVRRGLRVWHLYLFIAPSFAFLLLFEYYPALSAVFHAFTEWNGAGEWEWTGLDNFRAMRSDPALAVSIKNMLILLVWHVVQAITIPLIVAELIFNFPSQRWQYWFRLLLITPLVVPSVVESLVWRFFLAPPPLGLVNTILAGLGVGHLQRAWLGEADLAIYGLMITGFPWIRPVAMLIYFAGLQAIPESVIDASRIDGASTLRRVLSIDIPLLMGQLKLIFILNVIGGMQDFAWVLVITGGGPGYATLVPALHMYERAFTGGQFGYGAAIGLALFVVIFGLTLINQRYIRTPVETEA